MSKGVPKIFHWGQDRGPIKGRERGGVIGEGAARPSHVHQLRSLRAHCELPSEVWGGAPTAQRFPLFSALSWPLLTLGYMWTIMQPLGAKTCTGRFTGL